MTRVLIVAATPAMRAGLRTLLDHPAIQIVGDAAALGGSSALLENADLLLLADDAALNGLRYLLHEEGSLSVLVLADDERPVSLLRELPLASWGIVASDANPAELQAAILAVGQGFVVLPPSLTGKIFNQRLNDTGVESPSEPLTAREQEVLELMGQGLPNKQIARALQISEHTVKFHISAIFAKLGAASRTDAVGRAARQGLIAL